MADGTPDEPRHDVLVVGGGMVGASLARALADLELDVAVVEASPVAGAAAAQPAYDGRVVALGHGSRLILDALGFWRELEAGACPIHEIQVSDRGHLGAVRLRAREEGVPALGYVTGATLLGTAFNGALAALPPERLYAPARVVGLHREPDRAVCTLTGEGVPVRVAARLVVAADGTDSRLRALAGIGVRERAYGQSAITAPVTPARDPGGIAYERFTDTGPLALLPMHDGRYSLVWTVPEGQEDAILDLDQGAFLAALQERFGWRAGRFREVGERSVYPLRLVLAREQVGPRLVVMGNAAHALHPVAGQGLNLGLRDVAALAEVLADAAREGGDPGEPAVLARYRELRAGDQRLIATATDMLVRTFSSRLGPLALARNLGMSALDHLPVARHLLARRAMGLGGRLPRLARGGGV